MPKVSKPRRTLSCGTRESTASTSNGFERCNQRESSSDQVCEACQLGKQHRLPFPKESSISNNLLDVIHSDVWGPAQTLMIGGFRYYVTFIDDYSRYTWIFPMKKSEVLPHFQKLKGQVEKEIGWHIRCLRSNGGKEYFSDEFISYLQGKGIWREFSCQHTPQQKWSCRKKESANAHGGTRHDA